MRDPLVLFRTIESHSFQNYSTVNGRFCFYSHEDIQSVAIEMFRDSRNLSPTILHDTFTQKGNNWYNLRKISKFSRPLVKSVYHGNERVSFLGPKMWNMLPDDSKDIDNLYTFKNKVKKWKDENCPCRLCKIYINKGKKKLRKQKKAWDIQVVFLELWLLLTSIVLLPISLSFFFYLFNHLFLPY